MKTSPPAKPTGKSLVQGYLVNRLAAFSAGDHGGNPASVVLCDSLPDAAVMQAIAAEVGYSETAFAAPTGDAGDVWRVRYFAPEIEIPFCGHATIALGTALALRCGDGVFTLQLNDVRITVEGQRQAGQLTAALQSPPTHSAPVPADMLRASLALFGYDTADLDPRLPPAVAEGGSRHLILPLTSRRRLAQMRYDLMDGRALMRANSLTTVALVYAENPRCFHARNPFAAGGVYEDPATGAAAAALAGYLRDARWPHGGMIDIIQGEDMGTPCHLRAEIPPTIGASIRVSGTARRMKE